MFEGHGLAPSVIRAYREARERGELRLWMHAHASVPSNVLDDRALEDMLHHLSSTMGGRGPGDEEGINLGGASDQRVAEIVAGGYPCDQWAGPFDQAMPQDRFIEMCREAARLRLRVGCVVNRDLEYARQPRASSPGLVLTPSRSTPTRVSNAYTALARSRTRAEQLRPGGAAELDRQDVVDVCGYEGKDRLGHVRKLSASGELNRLI